MVIANLVWVLGGGGGGSKLELYCHGYSKFGQVLGRGGGGGGAIAPLVTRPAANLPQCPFYPLISATILLPICNPASVGNRIAKQLIQFPPSQFDLFQLGLAADTVITTKRSS